MYLDIRGLVSGQGKIHQFTIDELYIPLKTGRIAAAKEKPSKGGEAHDLEMVREIPLEQALTEKRLVVRGEPGAGKTTFLRLLAYIISKKRLGEAVDHKTLNLVWPEPLPLPILVRVGRLAEFIVSQRLNHVADAPIHDDHAECLLKYLEGLGSENNWGLTIEDFRRELIAGRCLIMLDGLDEAPDEKTRKLVSALAANLFKAYDQCGIVLSSRPAALVGEALPLGFIVADIQPLDEKAMESFLTQWSRALYAANPDKSKAHFDELRHALQARPEIKRMARTPVMLTALAVVQWNENHLPEQRVELYKSIIGWLLRQREKRPGRLPAKKCSEHLQTLALALFTHPQGRQRQVTPTWAASVLKTKFSDTPDATAEEHAAYFLSDEMIDSGIILERGKRLEFWHLSFQEYLAALEIAGKPDAEQGTLIFEQERLYSSEWHELMLLLGGVLHDQGVDKINLLLDAVIKTCPKKPTPQQLAQSAKAVALIGGMVQDLSPFAFKPGNPDYETLAQSVLGIFDPQRFAAVPVRIRAQAADALAQVGDPRLPIDLRAAGAGYWVAIPGGRFWRGAQKSNPKKQNHDPEARDNESPVHEVQLSPFLIGKYPVTVGQYRCFMEEGGYEDERLWRAGGFGKEKNPRDWQDQLSGLSRPVTGVSWYEAAAFCCWANGRLPTEAEWERAARGPWDEYKKYPWGNEEPSKDTANFAKSELNAASPVGIFPLSRSSKGVLDLAGNVWEWCADGYGEKSYTQIARQHPAVNPPGADKGDTRVLRGGSFNDYSDWIRCSSRYWYVPVNRNGDFGFRVARVPVL